MAGNWCGRQLPQLRRLGGLSEGDLVVMMSVPLAAPLALLTK